MSVRVEIDEHVTIVTIDRPGARNAVDRPTAAALASAFRAFDADGTQNVAVLTGAGDTFCAGADLKAFGTERANSVSTDGDAPMGPTHMMLTKPVIAAVEGYAVAGGLELALWCDLRVMAADATFGVFCRRWGVPLIDGGTVRLPRLVGHSHALDLILTGREVGAEEAPRSDSPIGSPIPDPPSTRRSPSPRDRSLPPGVPARRPAISARAVVHGSRRRVAQRTAGKPRGAPLPGAGGRPLRGRRGPPRSDLLTPGGPTDPS